MVGRSWDTARICHNQHVNLDFVCFVANNSSSATAYNVRLLGRIHRTSYNYPFLLFNYNVRLPELVHD
jgi:hypothetical protein